MKPFKAEFSINDRAKKPSSKKKGIVLEEIVEDLCSNYPGAKVTRNVIILGKSAVERQIDVLIETTYKSFDLKIVIEAKNYNKKVGIEIVEALRTKLTDVGGNLGVIVCPLGFTEGAIKAAQLFDIQLYQAFDHKLGNTTQFVPLRFIEPYIKSFQLRVAHEDSSAGRFELPMDPSEWCFHLQGRILNKDEAVMFAWNQGLIPQQAGNHVADFGIVKIGPKDNPSRYFYLELTMSVTIASNYYLKLFPASFMKNIQSGKGNHQLGIDIYSRKEDMLKNGWRYFETQEEMESAAEPHDTSPDVKGLVIKPSYTYGNKDS